MDAQKDKLKKYAEFQDMEIVGEYSDEGHSGKNIKGRQEFMRMLNDIEEGKDGVDFVLVFKLSRFGRNAEDEVEIIQMIFDRYIHTNDGTKTRMICRWAIIRVLHYPDSYTSLSRYAFNLFFSSM